MMTTRFCKDCIHSENTFPDRLTTPDTWHCTRYTEAYCPVLGTPIYNTCLDERRRVTGCGPDGRHFSVRPQPKKTKKEKDASCT